MERGVETNEGGRANLLDPFLVFGERYLERFCDLRLGGGAPLGLFELLHHGLNFAGLGMDGTRDPIHASQLVENRSSDTQASVGFKCGASSRIILANRAEQTA